MMLTSYSTGKTIITIVQSVLELSISQREEEGLNYRVKGIQVTGKLEMFLGLLIIIVT
jgi:hypothetical protein